MVLQVIEAFPVDPPGTAYLLSRAVLPARTFIGTTPSGAFITPAVTTNGVAIPFPGQPAQGFSGLLTTSKKGTYIAMCDNGYGAKANSADFLLRAYTLRPTFTDARNSRTCGRAGTAIGQGVLNINQKFIQFSDPNRLAGFVIVNENTPGRFLTGADFDVESIQRANDGSLWIGDEFGPFLLHFSAQGVLLDAPIPNGNLQSPSSPFLGSSVPTVGGSRGYEGMAMSPDKMFLYPILEGALVNETTVAPALVNPTRYIYEFDVTRKVYTGARWSYKVSVHSQNEEVFVADMQMIAGDRFMVLERDSFDGNPANVAKLEVKRIYIVNKNIVGADGYLVKTLLADLLNVRDGAGVSNDGTGGYGLASWTSAPIFKYALVSVEAILPLDNNAIVLIQDNNFPFNAGRVAGVADANEMLTIAVDRF